jgi:hypothetical protein
MAVEAGRKLWVCTVHGLAMLDLSYLRFDSAKPSIFVEEVTIERERHAVGRELVLPPGTRSLEPNKLSQRAATRSRTCELTRKLPARLRNY